MTAPITCRFTGLILQLGYVQITGYCTTQHDIILMQADMDTG